MKRTLLLLLTLFLLFGLFACNEAPSSPAKQSYVVYFNTSSLPYTVPEPAPVTALQGECVVEPMLSVEPTAGYYIVWSTSPTSFEAYDFSQPVADSFTLYAIEAPRAYNVTYLVQHGTNSAKNPLTYTKETNNIVLKNPQTEFGYVFRCWCYFDDPDSVVTQIEKGTEGDLILRARIEPVHFNILYAGGAEYNPNPSVYVFGETLVLQAPRRAGFIFTGYTIYNDPAHTAVTALTPEFVTQNAAALRKENGSDIYLQANWEEES